MQRIPTKMIGVLSDVISTHYTHDEINSLFLYAGAPEDVPAGSKAAKVQEWLRQTNQSTQEPLAVLGAILDDLLQKEIRNTPWSNDLSAALADSQRRVREALARDGLAYVQSRGVIRAGTTATLSLDENVRRNGLSAIQLEIERALSQVEADPAAACHYAANVLEATCKAYLDHFSVPYKMEAQLSELWQLTASQIGLKPQEWDDKDLKKIASGLHSIVDGVKHLRNKKSGAHGRSEQQEKTFRIKPRHARLAIHSAHTIAAYLVELIDESRS